MKTQRKKQIKNKDTKILRDLYHLYVSLHLKQVEDYDVIYILMKHKLISPTEVINTYQHRRLRPSTSNEPQSGGSSDMYPEFCDQNITQCIPSISSGACSGGDGEVVYTGFCDNETSQCIFSGGGDSTSISNKMKWSTKALRLFMDFIPRVKKTT